MSDTPKAADLAAHAATLIHKRRLLRERMAQVAAEHANATPEQAPQQPAP